MKKIQEFFLGTPREQNAAEQLKALREKSLNGTALSRKEQNRFDEAFKIVRAKVLRVAATLMVTTFGGTAVYLASDDGKPVPEHASATSGNASGFSSHSAPVASETTSTSALSSEEQIILVDQLMQKVEKGMVNLDNATREERKKLDPHQQEEIKSPFEVMKMNTENPNRNAPRMRKEKMAAGQKGFTMGNTYFLGYDVAKTDGYAAAFSPMERTMHLGENIDPNNLLDMLVVYHELRHSVQDANVRKEIKSQSELDQYTKFHTDHTASMGNLVLNDEASAYAYEIEMLNMLLKGALKENISSGKGMNIETIRKTLNSRPDQDAMIDMMIQLAGTYYPEGLSSGNLPRKFMNIIAKSYAARGFQVLIPWSSGELRLYKIEE